MTDRRADSHTPQATVRVERLHRFHGGLRLRHNKQISCREPLARPPLPERLVVPLLQHRGPPATPLVRPGQAVLKGDPLGEAPDHGARVHAPTSGIVLAIEERSMGHPTGQPGPCVVLRPDGDNRWGDRAPLSDWETATRNDLLTHLRNMGVVGLGGAVFPTDRKVETTRRRPIHTLILNGAECEPYIACDEMLMREAPRSVIEGARILRRAVGAEAVVIAIEDPMEAIGVALEAAVRDLGAERVQVVRVPALYPEGGERQLVQTLTGREVPDGGLPQDLGLLASSSSPSSSSSFLFLLFLFFLLLLLLLPSSSD